MQTPCCLQLVTHHPCPPPCSPPFHEQAPQEGVFHGISHHGSRGAGEPVPAAALPRPWPLGKQCPSSGKEAPGVGTVFPPRKSTYRTCCLLASLPLPRQLRKPQGGCTVFQQLPLVSLRFQLRGKQIHRTRFRWRCKARSCHSTARQAAQRGLPKLRTVSPAAFCLQGIQRERLQPLALKPRGRRLSLRWPWKEASSSREERLRKRRSFSWREASRPSTERAKVSAAAPRGQRKVRFWSALNIPGPSLPHSSPCEPGTLPTCAPPPFLSGAAPQPAMPGHSFHPAAYTGSRLPAGSKSRQW